MQIWKSLVVVKPPVLNKSILHNNFCLNTNYFLHAMNAKKSTTVSSLGGENAANRKRNLKNSKLTDFGISFNKKSKQEDAEKEGKSEAEEESKRIVKSSNKESGGDNNAKSETILDMNVKQEIDLELKKSEKRCTQILQQCEQVVLKSKSEGKPYPNLKDLLLEESWKQILNEEFDKVYLKNLNSFLREEVLQKKNIFPPAHMIFRALNFCPLESVKVVIIGQDPYHGLNQAMGLSFSVKNGVALPSSLKNIFNELKNDVDFKLTKNGNLEKWAYQGVLLLNTVLTVREKEANSHSKKGWETLTDLIITKISQNGNKIVFLLWGNYAQEKAKLIDNSKHFILKCAHPSGLSAHRGFFGCKHFSKSNEFLKNSNKLPIDWQL